MKKTIFVGGIHGVGKTSLCRALSDDYKLPHYSASRLISELKNEQFASDKKIEKIEENQDFLNCSKQITNK